MLLHRLPHAVAPRAALPLGPAGLHLPRLAAPRPVFVCAAAAAESGPAAGVEAAIAPADEDEAAAKERLRRERISAANSGKTPWNKGRKHSPETIAKIRERTKQAMARDDVAERVRVGRAQVVHTHEESVKERIRNSLNTYYIAKRQEAAAAAGLTVEEYDAMKPRRSRRKLKEAAEGGAEGSPPPVLPKPRRRAPKAAAAAAADGAADASADATASGAASTSAAARARPKRAKAPAPPKDPSAPANRSRVRSPEHRAAIAESIRRKWRDPDYRDSALEGMRRAVESRGGDGAAPSRTTAAPRRSSTAGRSGPGSSSSSSRASASSSRANASSSRASASSGGGASSSKGGASGRSGGAGARPGAASADGDSSGAADATTVRSTRMTRSDAKRAAEAAEAEVEAEEQQQQPKRKRSAGASGNGGGSGGSATPGYKRPRSSVTHERARPAASGGSGSSAEQAAAAAAVKRLALVKRLVSQVLTAERLVANTEGMVHNFTKKRHLLRNDPILRAHAETSLRAVAATLAAAKAKLDLLRSRIPPDARYNEEGDVWFAADGAAAAAWQRPGPQAASAPEGAAADAALGGGDADEAWDAQYEDADDASSSSSSDSSSRGAGGGPRGPLYDRLAFDILEGGDLSDAEGDEDDAEGGGGGPRRHWPPGGAPNGHAGGPAGPFDVGSFPGVDPGDAGVRVDVSNIDLINTLGLGPVNGHSKPHGVASALRPDGALGPRPGSDEHGGSGGDGGGGRGGGGGGSSEGIAAGEASPQHSMPSGRLPLEADGEGAAAARRAWLGAGASAHGPSLSAEASGAAAAGAGALAQGQDEQQAIWLAASAGSISALRARLPPSHSWLADALDGGMDLHSVIQVVAESAGHDAAANEVLRLLHDRAAAEEAAAAPEPAPEAPPAATASSGHDHDGQDGTPAADDPPSTVGGATTAAEAGATVTPSPRKAARSKGVRTQQDEARLAGGRNCEHSSAEAAGSHAEGAVGDRRGRGRPRGRTRAS